MQWRYYNVNRFGIIICTVDWFKKTWFGVKQSIFRTSSRVLRALYGNHTPTTGSMEVRQKQCSTILLPMGK